MANYQEICRSNYFRVKDMEAFVKFIQDFEGQGMEIIKSDDDEELVGFLAPGGLPSSRYHEESETYEDIDFTGELAEYLADGEVAIIMGVGWEELRYVNGYAIAINNKGEIRHTHLDRIYDLAKEIAENEATKAEY